MTVSPLYLKIRKAVSSPVCFVPHSIPRGSREKMNVMPNTRPWSPRAAPLGEPRAYWHTESLRGCHPPASLTRLTHNIETPPHFRVTKVLRSQQVPHTLSNLNPGVATGKRQEGTCKNL